MGEASSRDSFEFKKVGGGLLVQNTDLGRITADDLKVVTERAPTPEQVQDMLFAWTVVKYVKSNAIIFYLASGTPLLPDDDLSRARVLQWMFFEQYSHEPFIATLRNWISYANKRDEYASEIEAFRPKGYAALDVMEQHLESRNYLVGESYSIADIALYAYTHVADEGGFELYEYGNILRWFAELERVPGYVPMQ